VKNVVVENGVDKLKECPYFTHTLCPVVSNGRIYAVDDAQKLHIYDIKADKWEVIKMA